MASSYLFLESSSGEVKNAWSCDQYSSVWRHGVRRENFALAVQLGLGFELHWLLLCNKCLWVKVKLCLRCYAAPWRRVGEWKYSVLLVGRSIGGERSTWHTVACTLGAEPSVPIRYEAGWAAGLVWAMWSAISASPRIRLRSAVVQPRRLVSVTNELGAATFLSLEGRKDRGFKILKVRKNVWTDFSVQCSPMCERTLHCVKFPILRHFVLLI